MADVIDGYGWLIFVWCFIQCWVSRSVLYSVMYYGGKVLGHLGGVCPVHTAAYGSSAITDICHFLNNFNSLIITLFYCKKWLY